MPDQLSPPQPAASSTIDPGDAHQLAQAAGESKIDQARAAGYSDDEISRYLAPKITAARQYGYSTQEIQNYLGLKPGRPFDDNLIRSQLNNNFAASAKPVTSFEDALSAGWQMSVTGMAMRGKPPEKTISPDAPMMSRLANGVAMLGGDLPAMVGGFAAGALGAAETGPGAVVGGTAGAMALPTALRETLMDSYQHGHFQNFSDFWGRVAPIFVDTAKSWITGAATGAAGKAAGAVAPAITASPIAQSAIQDTAAVATMTEVGKRLEGETPSAQDFVDAAVMLGGLKFAGAGAAKLRGIYAQTGIKPQQVVADAQRDPSVQQDILSRKGTPDAYAQAPPEQTAENAPRETSTAKERLAEVSQAEAQRSKEEEQGLQPGMVRLYHGGGDPTDGGPRWVTPNLDYAKGYAEKSGGQVWYTDVPEDHPEVLANTDFNMVQGTNMKASLMYFEASEGIAKGMRPLEEATPLEGEILPPEGPPGAPPPERPQPQEPPPASPEEAQDRILSHMSVGERTPERPWTLQRVLSNVYSDIYPIEAAAKRLGGGELPTIDDPGRLASMMAGAGGITERFIHHDTLDFNTGRPNGASLKTVLDNVPDKDMDGFRAYVAARHALDLNRQGIETGFDLNAARMVLQNGAKFEQSANDFTGYLNRVSAYLRDAGVISKEGYDVMVAQRPFYVPFQRVMEKLGGGAKGGAGGGFEAFDPVHSMIGSQRMVIDPVESAIRNTALFVQMAEKNQVATKLVDLLLPHGEAERTDVPPPPRVDLDALRAAGVNTDPLEGIIQAARPTEGAEIRVFRNGQAESYRVDPELAIAMKNLDRQSTDFMTKILGPLSQTLRAGAVLQPDFMLRHLVRDYQYAFTTSPGGFSPLWMVRGIAAQLGKTEDYQNWLSSGGARATMVSLDRQYLQHSIDELTGTGILDRAWNVLQDPTASSPQKAGAVGRLPWEFAKKYLISYLQMGVELAENASHIGQFIKSSQQMSVDGAPLTKEQLLEAGYQSRKVAVDAARIGSAMRMLNSVSAFSNITVQDTARVIKNFAERPMAAALSIGLMTTLPSIYTWWNGHNDSRYKEAPAWERDLFWVFPTDRWVPAKGNEARGLPADLVKRDVDGTVLVNKGITWRIPKPWNMGLIFGSGVERMLNEFQDHSPHAFEGFGSSLFGTTIPNMIPNALTPMIEQFANRSTFTNRTLVPSQQEKWLPEYQYTDYTSETAKAIGRIVGALPGVSEAKTGTGPFGGTARALSSPILLENYLRAWTGNLGMYALSAADYGLRKEGIVPDPPQPTKALADMPFIKAFVVRMPTAGTESIQNFHDAYARNKEYFDTFQGMRKQGTPEAQQAMRQIIAVGGPQIFAQMSQIDKTLSEQSRIIQDIYKNPKIPDDEKRQVIDTVYWRMTELARIGNQAMDRISSITLAPRATIH